MVQYSFISTETRRLIRTDSPGRPPRLSHSSWTMMWTLSTMFTYMLAEALPGKYMFDCSGSSYKNIWLSAPKSLAFAIDMYIPSFVSSLATEIRWVLLHPLMLRMGNKNFNLFILSGGSFFFPCPQALVPCIEQWLATQSLLINWLANQCWPLRKTSHNQTCDDIFGGKKALAMCWWSSQSYFAKQLCRILKTALKCKNSGTLLGCMLPVCV